MAHNSNKLTKLDGQQNEIVSGPLIHRVGEPYYSYYVYEYAGVDAETGKEMFYLNDGTENARKTTTNISEANKTIVGKHQASIEGGLTNNLKWKFIDLGFTFTYSLGGDALTTPLGSTQWRFTSIRWCRTDILRHLKDVDRPGRHECHIA